jgi:CheY-like chemotaxis protein
VAKRILIVDDDDHVRKLEQAILERPGYEVSSASSGREALDRLAAGESYDLIILDVMMPEMDGFEVCRQIKSDPSGSASGDR